MEKKETIEESISSIRNMADTLESAEISLEEAFSIYEEAMKKIRDVSVRLDEVSEKIEILSAGEGRDEEEDVCPAPSEDEIG